MGHHITAYADQGLSKELASLRLFPSQARDPGNIYEVLGCQDLRRSCSGTGEVAEFAADYSHQYPVRPNADTQAFLSTVFDSWVGERLWIKFS